MATIDFLGSASGTGQANAGTLTGVSYQPNDFLVMFATSGFNATDVRDVNVAVPGSPIYKWNALGFGKAVLNPFDNKFYNYTEVWYRQANNTAVNHSVVLSHYSSRYTTFLVYRIRPAVEKRIVVRSVNWAAARSTAPSATSLGELGEGSIVFGIQAPYGSTSLFTDTDTLNGSWSARSSRTGSSPTRAIGTQYKTPTADGVQTYNGSYGSNTLWVAGVLNLLESNDGHWGTRL